MTSIPSLKDSQERVFSKLFSSTEGIEGETLLYMAEEDRWSRETTLTSLKSKTFSTKKESFELSSQSLISLQEILENKVQHKDLSQNLKIIIPLAIRIHANQNLTLIDNRMESLYQLFQKIDQDLTIDLHFPLFLEAGEKSHWTFCRQYQRTPELLHLKLKTYVEETFFCTQESHGEYYLLNTCEKDLSLNSVYHLLGEQTQLNYQGIHFLYPHHQEEIQSQIYCYAQSQFVKQTTRVLSAGDSRGLFQGQMILKPEAKKSEAHQKTICTLLHPKAHFLARPQMLIETGDVVCTHGATYGQLQQEEMFYLQARGIPFERARMLVAFGPIRSMLESLQDQSLRDKWIKDCESALPSLLNLLHEGGDL
jgi:Fe-S cluster assembly scaffold protein SufB